MQNWHVPDAARSLLKKIARERARCMYKQDTLMRHAALCYACGFAIIVHTYEPPSPPPSSLTFHFGANIFAKPTYAGSFLLRPLGAGFSGHFCTGTATLSILHMLLDNGEGVCVRIEAEHAVVGSEHRPKT